MSQNSGQKTSSTITIRTYYNTLVETYEYTVVQVHRQGVGKTIVYRYINTKLNHTYTYSILFVIITKKHYKAHFFINTPNLSNRIFGKRIVFLFHDIQVCHLTAIEYYVFSNLMNTLFCLSYTPVQDIHTDLCDNMSPRCGHRS